MDPKEPLIYRLRKRAEIRRQITTRKSVQEGAPDRIADLLEEAATALEAYEKGQADTEAMNRLQDLVNPACEHGTRTNWCKVCEAKRDEEAAKRGRF